VGHIPADHWTQNPTIGGGRIKGEACHFIDLIRFLVGKPIVSWSSNLLGKNVTKDTVTLSFLFEDRSIGTIHYFANGSKNFPKERVEVFCNNGILQLDNFRKLKGFGWPGFKSKKLFKQDKGHYNEIQSFLESIKSNSNQPIPFDEIMEVSRTTIEIADAL
jgi:predicted dehydrogenase